jgi:hypothetical protein
MGVGGGVIDGGNLLVVLYVLFILFFHLEVC